MREPSDPTEQSDVHRLRKLYQQEHHPSQDQKWKVLGNAYPDIARLLLIKAHELRQSKGDSGDTYVQGAADVFALLNRQDLIEKLKFLADN